LIVDTVRSNATGIDRRIKNTCHHMLICHVRLHVLSRAEPQILSGMIDICTDFGKPKTATSRCRYPMAPSWIERFGPTYRACDSTRVCIPASRIPKSNPAWKPNFFAGKRACDGLGANRSGRARTIVLLRGDVRIEHAPQLQGTQDSGQRWRAKRQHTGSGRCRRGGLGIKKNNHKAQHTLFD